MAEGVLKAVATGLVVGEIPHAVTVFAVVPVDGAPEVDAGLFPGVVGGEDGTGLDAVGALDEAGEATAIRDFVVVNEEVEVGVGRGGWLFGVRGVCVGRWLIGYAGRGQRGFPGGGLRPVVGPTTEHRLARSLG